MAHCVSVATKCVHAPGLASCAVGAHRAGGGTIGEIAMHRILAISCCYLAVAAAASSSAGGELKGDYRLLEKLAEADRRNGTMQLSWEGTIEVEELRRLPEKGEEVRFRATVDYYWEFRMRAARWDWQYHEAVRSGPAGEQAIDLAPVRTALYQSAVYRVETDPQTGERTATIQGENELEDGPLGTDIGSILYWVKVEGEFVYSWAWKFLQSLQDRIENENIAIVIEEQGQMIVLRVDEPDAQRWAEYTFDVSRGGLLAASRVRTGEREVTTRAELVQIAHHWLPWRALYEEHVGGTLLARRSLRWKENELAAGLEATAFRLASLGLRPGDWIHDTRMELHYRWDGERGPPGRRPGRFPAPARRPPAVPEGATPADVNLLAALADALGANLDALQTWAGEISVHGSYANEGVEDESSGRLEYLADLARGRARWEFQRTHFRARRSGPASELAAGPVWRFLDTGSEFYRVRSTPEGQVLRAEILADDERPRAPYDADALDLAFWLGIDGSRLDVWLRNLHRRAVAGTGAIGVGRAGDEVTVYLAGGWQAGGEEFTFDLAQGGWLTSARRRHGGLAVSLAIKVQQIEIEGQHGLWLPAEIVYSESPQDAEELRGKPGAAPILRRVLTWTRSEPNVVLPDDAFTPAALGIEPGIEVRGQQPRQ